MKQLRAAVIIFFCFTFFIQQLNAQSSNSLQQWNAKWIAAPNDNGTEYGVYYFRKNITLATKPSSFVIHVSADNRYKLFVNDSLISIGPARGDLHYWNYETIDIAPYLTQGKNIIAALVWNEADHRPEAQMSLRTAFIVQGNTSAEEIINTNKSWKCIRDKSFKPSPAFFFAAITAQMVDMNEAIQDWQKINHNDSSWSNASELFDGKLKGTSDGFGWMLVPTILPTRELTYQRIPVLRKADGINMPANFPATNAPVIIPPHTTATLLLDQTYLTNAYVTLKFSNGKGAGISLSYAEALFDNFKKYGWQKGNRNEVDGKDFAGDKDTILSNGRERQSFTTLNFRTYRYVQMIVHTQDDALTINDLYGTFTGYPFKQTAVFNSDNSEIKNILDIGWRTARLNAFETYTDCPYYEQLQYIGDTRIQAMVSYYYSGDDRLARNALNLMDHSRLPEGVTLSRYPTHSTQIISTFSLWYIGMLYDFYMYRNDSNFIKDKLIGTREILNFFSTYQQADGSLKNTPYWTFVDWADGKDWSVGSPPKGADGSSAIIDLQLLWAYEWAAKMESQIGLSFYAKLYAQKIAQLKQTIQHTYWDATKKLYSDTEDKTLFSQHANALAVLTGMVNESDSKKICQTLLTDKSLTQCTIYFKYYLHMALVKGGYGDDYMNWLDVWRDNIKLGMTTWAEVSDVEHTRSDCHAWGSSPNIEFFRTVLGVDSYSPGFKEIKIEPHLGDLKNVSGEIPHPSGKVQVAYMFDKNKWHIEITLPPNTTGFLKWKSKQYQLKTGLNIFDQTDSTDNPHKL